MDIKNTYPEYAAIEEHIRRAHVERAVVLSHLIVAGITRAAGVLRTVFASVARGIEAGRDARSVEADAFMKRSIPHY